MNVYRITGTFPNGPVRQLFSLDLVAADEAEARARVYSELGSRHRARRRHITIASIDSIAAQDSVAAEVISAFRDGVPAVQEEE